MKRILEIDPAEKETLIAVKRVEPLHNAQLEKQKAEMLGKFPLFPYCSFLYRLSPHSLYTPPHTLSTTTGKLKDIGNGILGKFGMSLNNFNAVKDPNTGSYSISFNQGNGDAPPNQ